MPFQQGCWLVVLLCMLWRQYLCSNAIHVQIMGGMLTELDDGVKEVEHALKVRGWQSPSLATLLTNADRRPRACGMIRFSSS